ncbi:MAG: hypothetical protein ABSG68_21905 [Thermoguttaceae bacterium]|jgi:hypothetical protein
MKKIHLLWCVLILVAGGPTQVPARADEKAPVYAIHSSRQGGQVDKVAVILEVGGDLLEQAEGKVRRVPMDGTCTLTYEERNLDPGATPDSGNRSLRYYEKAIAQIKAGPDSKKLELRPERVLVAVRRDPQEAFLFSPRGELTDDELQLIDVQGNSVLLDGLLPEPPIHVGENWKVPQKALVPLLALDELRSSTVEMYLKEVTPLVARMELAGEAEGVINGVTAKIDLKAKCRFDLKTKRIDWFAMLVKEKREISVVEHGFDVTARVQVRITPQPAPQHVSDEALKDVSLEATPALAQLLFQAADGSWCVLHDRRWHMTDRYHDLALFRFLDHGQEAAMCKISPAMQVPEGKKVSLEEFRGDVQKTLGKDFGAFVEADRLAGDAGYESYRAVVRGTVSDVPIQWHYYLVGDGRGRQAAFAFTVEEKRLEVFGKTGERLVRSFRFLEPKKAEKATPEKADKEKASGAEKANIKANIK